MAFKKTIDTMPTLCRRVAIYIRVSTNHQIDRDSLPLQREELINYAKYALNIEDYEIFHDYNETYSTVKDQCICAYTDEVVSSVLGGCDGNIAPKCFMFRRSDKGYWYRDRTIAEANYEKYQEE